MVHSVPSPGVAPVVDMKEKDAEGYTIQIGI